MDYCAFFTCFCFYSPASDVCWCWLSRQTWKLSTMIKNNIVSPRNFHFSVGSWSQCIQLYYLPCSLAYACAIYARLSRFVLCFVPWGCMLLAVTQHTEYTACVAAWALASYKCQLLLIILLLLLYSCAEGLLQKKNCNSLTKTITFFSICVLCIVWATLCVFNIMFLSLFIAPQCQSPNWKLYPIFHDAIL